MRILYHVEDNAHCFLRVLGVRRGKPENADDTFTISSLQVSAFVGQTRSGLANKFCCGFSERRRLRTFCEGKLVTNIAHHHAYFVRFRVRIERSCGVLETAKFLFRKAIGKERSHHMRAISP